MISMYGPEMQASSDAVGEAFAQALVDDRGAVQEPREIFDTDGSNGLRALGIPNRANWAGALPFSAAGYPLITSYTGFETDTGYFEELTLLQRQWALQNHALAATIVGVGSVSGLGPAQMDGLAAGVVRNPVYNLTFQAGSALGTVIDAVGNWISDLLSRAAPQPPRPPVDAPTQRLQQQGASDLLRYGVYDMGLVGNRLVALGLVDQAQWNQSGFAALGGANAGLSDLVVQPVQGETRFLLNTDCGAQILLDPADGWRDSGSGAGGWGAAQEVRLNPVVDWAINNIGGAQNHVSPLVLDLDGDGVELIHAYRSKLIAGLATFEMEA
jgi:hypothetical protein